MEGRMIPKDAPRTSRTDFLLAAVMIAGGIVMSGAALMHLPARDPVQTAQTTQPSDPSPSVPAGKENGPADPEPGGARPTTPPPEPARPDADAQKKGATPALPPAPAEKIGEPIRR
jgi:hypothetical protein